MALFTNEEKTLLQESLTLYLQLMQQRMPKSQVEQVLRMAQGLMDKIDQAEEGGMGAPSDKPRGISDEWFKNCCLQCEQLAPGGRCMDKITEKFPGKCDPILLYERAKNVKS